MDNELNDTFLLIFKKLGELKKEQEENRLKLNKILKHLNNNKK